MGVTYRTRQFWKALLASPTTHELKQVEAALSPKLMSLFTAMQPDEQAHSYSVFKALLENGAHHPDLLVAALLHDVGKSRHKLHLGERVLIVVGKKFFPQQSKKWGIPVPGWKRSWQRAFVIAQQHPIWGAQMAEEAGASPLVVQLIRWHQEEPNQFPYRFSALETNLMEKLQQLDGSY